MKFPTEKLEACYWESDPDLQLVSSEDVQYDGVYYSGNFIFQEKNSGTHYRCKFVKSNSFREGLNYRFTEECTPVKPVKRTVVDWIPVSTE